VRPPRARRVIRAPKNLFQPRLLDSPEYAAYKLERRRLEALGKIVRRTK
jgi:hypothetical protein